MKGLYKFAHIAHLTSGVEGCLIRDSQMELKVTPSEGHSLTSLTIQVEIKDPRILFKITQGITQLSGFSLNKIQLNVPSQI